MNSADITGILKKIRYFGPFLPLSHLFTTFFGKIISDKTLAKIESKRNIKIQRKLKKFVNNAIVNCKDKGNNLPSTETSNKIWICWLQGEEKITSLSKYCFESIKKNANGREVILLTQENLAEYVKMPEIIIRRFKEGSIKPAHFADLIRINILAQQGGLWLDATILCTAPLDNEIFERNFWTIKTKEEGHYVSKCRWSVFALAAEKNNLLFSLLSEIFEEYLKKYPVLIDYFMFDQLINMLYDEVPEIKQMIDEVSYNNPEVHELNKYLKGEDTHSLDEIFKNTSLFKLSNKTPYIKNPISMKV